MQIIYEGKDIANIVEINKADITDTDGGQSDSLELWMNDTEGLWSKWKPQKNDTIQVKQNGFDSGIVYVDELEQKRGVFILRALSIPQESKMDNSKGWEKICFISLAGELAAKYGFKLETYGVDNCLYDRVDQYEQADFEHLAYRCMLEGYILKITGQKAVIYSEPYMEGLDAVKTIAIDMFDGDYKFKTKSTGIYGGCSLIYGSISSEYIVSSGPILKITNMPVSNQGEADRFCRNILRFHNKQESTGCFTIQYDPGLAAGVSINISGVGLADGKYFCEQVIHKLVERKTMLRVRKPLEGY